MDQHIPKGKIFIFFLKKNIILYLWIDKNSMDKMNEGEGGGERYGMIPIIEIRKKKE